MRSVEVLVIGGGASGLVAAIMARRQGNKVLILEKKKQLGKKILATGNGKCNFTNKKQHPSCYRSATNGIAWDILSKFTWSETIDWFRELGILAKQRDGYVYPASNQASAVRNALEREALRLGVQIQCEEPVLDIEAHISYKTGKKDGFFVTTAQNEYLAKKVIVATGGMAAPVHGSTGDGYCIAKKYGHHIETVVPALTSFLTDGIDTKGWAGIRIHGTVVLKKEDGDVLCTDSGELQMVATGISGIPVFQVSRFGAKELKKGNRVFLDVDCMTEYTKEQIMEQIQCRRTWDESQSAKDVLEGFLPDKLGSVLLKKCNISPKTQVGTLTKTQMEQIATLIKKIPLEVTGTGDFDKAQVTAGGISLTEIDADTMESVFAKGLYFTGEILDVDGICGGYNLQWAWTTGYLAGIACQKKGIE